MRAVHAGALGRNQIRNTQQKAPRVRGLRLPQGLLSRLEVFVLAEREGFEPSVVLPLRLISSQVHSTTLPPLRVRFRLSKPVFYQADSVSKPPI
jgi:hypothetical protein